MDGFDDEALNVIVLAEREARLMNHSIMGSEHMLLGLLAVEQGIVARALASMGIYLENCRKATRHRVGTRPQLVPESIPHSYRAKRLMERADIMAAQRHIERTRPEHLMLSILEDEDSTATEVIEVELEVSAEELQERLLAMMNGADFPPEIPIEYYGGDYEFRAFSSMDALRNLSAAHSFLSSREVPDQVWSHLGAQQKAFGVYFNGEDDCIVLGADELIWLDGAAQTNIQYRTIASVDLPPNPADPYLKITLKESSKVIMLPVTQETEGVWDYEDMFEFLYYQIQLSKRQPLPKPEPPPKPFTITDINSQADFLKYVKQPGISNNNLRRLTRWLERGALDEVWLDALNVPPDRTHDGAFWRLLAAMLVRFPEAAEELA